MRGSQHALVVVDMPFGSYETSKEQAFHSAVRILKETHCGAVKLEGGVRMAQTIAFLVERGVPVMGHIGLTPQSINVLGSFRAQGREEGTWEPIENDARAVSQAGAFSVVVEAVAEPLARKITETIAIPTIGIGASSACDGGLRHRYRYLFHPCAKHAVVCMLSKVEDPICRKIGKRSVRIGRRLV